MKPVFCHIMDSHNLGDMLCGAKGLFPEWEMQPEYNYRQLPEAKSPVILGGGGLLHPGIDRWIQKTSKQRPVIPFGIGLNYHVGRPLLSMSRRRISIAVELGIQKRRGIPDNWESFVADCPVVGLRDRSLALERPSFRYCPCPTLGLIDWQEVRSEASHDRECLVIEHYDFPIPGFLGADRLTNLFTGEAIFSIAKKLANYRLVVANTYHGALWALNAGCRVAVFSPFSSRFRSGFPCKIPIIFSEMEMWQVEAIWNTAPYRSEVARSLAEAQQYLDSFRREVRGLLCQS